MELKNKKKTADEENESIIRKLANFIVRSNESRYRDDEKSDWEKKREQYKKRVGRY